MSKCVQRVMPCRASRGYTLLELLIVIALLGLAGALVIPTMGETGILRVQGAIRQVVADMTFAQSDAVAFQERRAVVFDVPNNRYSVVQVTSDTIDVANNTLFTPHTSDGRYRISLNDERFGGSTMTSVNFGGPTPETLIFDAMGGPITDPGSNNPGPGGTITIQGTVSRWFVRVEAFTGRITVEQDRSGR